MSASQKQNKARNYVPKPRKEKVSFHSALGAMEAGVPQNVSAADIGRMMAVLRTALFVNAEYSAVTVSLDKVEVTRTQKGAEIHAAKARKAKVEAKLREFHGADVRKNFRVSGQVFGLTEEEIDALNADSSKVFLSAKN